MGNGVLSKPTVEGEAEPVSQQLLQQGAVPDEELTSESNAVPGRVANQPALDPEPFADNPDVKLPTMAAKAGTPELTTTDVAEAAAPQPTSKDIQAQQPEEEAEVEAEVPGGANLVEAQEGLATDIAASGSHSGATPWVGTPPTALTHTAAAPSPAAPARLPTVVPADTLGPQPPPQPVEQRPAVEPSSPGVQEDTGGAESERPPYFRKPPFLEDGQLRGSSRSPGSWSRQQQPHSGAASTTDWSRASEAGSAAPTLESFDLSYMPGGGGSELGVGPWEEEVGPGVVAVGVGVGEGEGSPGQRRPAGGDGNPDPNPNPFDIQSQIQLAEEYHARMQASKVAAVAAAAGGGGGGAAGGEARTLLQPPTAGLSEAALAALRPVAPVAPAEVPDMAERASEEEVQQLVATLSRRPHGPAGTGHELVELAGGVPQADEVLGRALEAAREDEESFRRERATAAAAAAASAAATLPGMAERATTEDVQQLDQAVAIVRQISGGGSSVGGGGSGDRDHEIASFLTHGVVPRSEEVLREARRARDEDQREYARELLVALPPQQTELQGRSQQQQGQQGQEAEGETKGRQSEGEGRDAAGGGLLHASAVGAGEAVAGVRRLVDSVVGRVTGSGAVSATAPAPAEAGEGEGSGRSVFEAAMADVQEVLAEGQQGGEGGRGAMDLTHRHPSLEDVEDVEGVQEREARVRPPPPPPPPPGGDTSSPAAEADVGTGAQAAVQRGDTTEDSGGAAGAGGVAAAVCAAAPESVESAQAVSSGGGGGSGGGSFLMFDQAFTAASAAAVAAQQRITATRRAAAHVLEGAALQVASAALGAACKVMGVEDQPGEAEGAPAAATEARELGMTAALEPAGPHQEGAPGGGSDRAAGAAAPPRPPSGGKLGAMAADAKSVVHDALRMLD